MRRFRSRCPVQVVKGGRVVQCGTMINTTDGMCAEHWATVPVTLQKRFVEIRLGTAPSMNRVYKRSIWTQCVRAAERAETKDESAPWLQLSAL